jgi:RecA-family ATPase
MAQEHGLDRVKYEILNQGLGITQHPIRSLVKEPPPKEWLVDNLLEKSKPALLASIGGVGKSMMALDLAIKISQGQGNWFDHPITKGGNVVIISAEDDLVEMHRRINALDPHNKRFDAPYDVYTYTIPDQPKPLTLINDTSAGMGLTEQAQELLAELETIPNLELVVIDPIQAVCGSAKISSDNEAGQMYGQLAASISSKFKTTCLSIHHMSKGALQADDDVMQIRSKIRGASSLVDSTRLCIALWLGEEEEAERICLDNDVEYDRLRVVKGAVVKSNSSEVDTKTKTLFRREAVLEPYKETFNFGEF